MSSPPITCHTCQAGIPVDHQGLRPHSCPECGRVVAMERVPEPTAWFFIQEGKKAGPVSAAELRRLMDLGTLGPSDMVLGDGNSKWEVLANLTEKISSGCTQPSSLSETVDGSTPPAPEPPALVATVAVDEASLHLEQVVSRFELAWQHGQRPQIVEFLPASGTGRTEIIIALVHADLEYRIKAGEPARIEEYVARFPDLSGNGEVIRDLIGTEFRVRKEREPALSEAEYAARFPGAASEPTGLVIPRLSQASTQVFPGASAPGAPPPVDKNLPRIPGYVVLGVLGRGGMGVVYQARHLRLRRLVALKMVLAGAHAGPEQFERFLAEARAVAQLQHPHVVQVYEVGEHEGQPYFSLEYVEGGSLDKKLAGVPQPPTAAAQLVETLARAVDAAHQRGIVHRDLKPGNVLLSTDGTPKITDFGLAKQLDGDSLQTRSGAIVGTPSYMAPEQAMGRGKEVGPAADVYALGAMFYEMLTGRPPFRAATVLDTLELVCEAEPVPPSRLQPGLPRDLETICLKCLQKEPARRYRAAADLAEDLRRFLTGEPIHARPIGAAERMVKWARRRPTLAALVVLAGLIAIAVPAALLRYSSVVQRHNRDLQDAYEEVKQKESLALAAEQEVRVQRDAALTAEREVRTQRDAALKAEETAKREADISRRNLFNLQLTLASSFLDRDPRRARQMLEDERYCPVPLRDFAWGRLHRSCRRELWRVKAHEQAVTALAYADRSLATAGQDGRLRFWDAGTGAAQGESPARKESILALAVHPDGNSVAIALDDGSVDVVERKTGRRLAALKGHREAVRTLAFSTDGKLLASGDQDGIVKLWNPPGEKEQATLKAHAEAVRCLCFSADGKVLATAGEDGVVKAWEVGTQRELYQLRGHSEAVHRARFSRNGRWLLSASLGSVVLWELPGRTQHGVIQRNPGGISDATFTPDDRTLVVTNLDGSVELWDLTGREPRQRSVLRGSQNRCDCAAVSPDGRELAVGSGDGSVQTWTITGIPGEIPLLGHDQVVLTLAFSSNGKWLASGSQDTLVKLWDVAGRREQARFPADIGRITGVAFAPDNRRVALCGANAAVKLWDIEKNQELVRLEGHNDFLHGVAISPDGQYLASAGGDAIIKLWGLKTFKEVGTLSGHKDKIWFIAFSPDGRSIASAGGDGVVKVWDVPTRSERATLTGHRGRVNGVAFSPNGDVLASAGADGLVKIWDLKSRRELTALRPLQGEVNAVAFSHDRQTLASAGSDGSVKLWDAIGGHERATLRAQAGAVLCLAFSPDDRLLATGSANRSIVLWEADSGR